MKTDLYSPEGQVVGQVELPDEVFNIVPSEYAMYMAVRAYLRNRRQGTHKTKTRKEVSGGGRKPWPQKGRGVARAGSIRSPLWVGGGKVHGPQPRDYSMKIPKKLKILARKSALSVRAQEGNIIVVTDFDFEVPKTKQMVTVLRALGLDGVKTLQLLPKPLPNVMLSGRNIPTLHSLPAFMVSAYDILSHARLLLHQSAIEVLVGQFLKEEVV